MVYLTDYKGELIEVFYSEVDAADWIADFVLRNPFIRAKVEINYQMVIDDEYNNDVEAFVRDYMERTGGQNEITFKLLEFEFLDEEPSYVVNLTPWQGIKQ